MIPIVGTRHHPTAAALMPILAHGTKIHLDLDPYGTVSGIQHTDRTGVCVRLHRDDLKLHSAAVVQAALAPLGFSTQTILTREWWHLGFIPAKWPRDTLPPLPTTGTLAFSARGAPQVEGIARALTPPRQ